MIGNLSAEINEALQQPELRKQINESGAKATGSTPEQFAALMRDEVVRRGKVVKESGAQIDWDHRVFHYIGRRADRHHPRRYRPS